MEGLLSSRTWEARRRLPDGVSIQAHFLHHHVAQHRIILGKKAAGRLRPMMQRVTAWTAHPAATAAPLLELPSSSCKLDGGFDTKEFVLGHPGDFVDCPRVPINIEAHATPELLTRRQLFEGIQPVLAAQGQPDMKCDGTAQVKPFRL